MRLTLILLFLLCLSGPTGCTGSASQPVRVATFNTALSRSEAGQLHAAFTTGDDQQAKLVAEVLQRTRPDIVLLQEVDYDPTGKAYDDFQRNYLAKSQNGAEPIAYEHVYAPPVNTGVLAEVDLDGDGQITRPNDCYGYGLFEGQYGMVVLSRYPIISDEIRNMRDMLWRDMPDNLLPTDYYSDAAQSRLRLSSKTHADVPVEIGDTYLRLFISHPTPPVFDGPEDRNGRRNRDEILFWRDYIADHAFNPRTIYEVQGGKDAERRVFAWLGNYTVMGDLNADPFDGESRRDAVLTSDPMTGLQDPKPKSNGGIEAARLQAGKNLTHKSNPAHDTADFGDKGRDPGNLRVDYVLPSIQLDVVGSGIYWPTTDDPYAYLNKASDHKLVWVDLRLP